MATATGLHHRRSRTSSIRSERGLKFKHSLDAQSELKPTDSGVRYKDILDAQSEIRPADFKGRVRASGARDYGEDVADRNIAQNGLDHGSPSVRTKARPSNESRPVNNTPLLEKPELKTGRVEPRFRTKGLHPLTQHPIPKRMSSVDTVSPDSESAPALERRRSVNTYFPASSLRVKGPSARSVSPTSVADIRRGSPTVEVDINRNPPVAESPAVRTTRVPRDSVILAKKKTGTKAAGGVDDDGSSVSGLIQSNARLSAIGTGSSVPHKRASLLALQFAVTKEAEGSATSIDPNNIITPVDEDPEHSPSPRTRSVRGWSASSSTPTTADSTTTTITSTSSGGDSSLSQPSDSFRTAATSLVDLPASALTPLLGHLSQLRPLLSKPSASRSLRSVVPRYGDDDDGYDSDSASFYPHDDDDNDDARSSHHTPPSPDNDNSFNIDDYLSADDVSFTGAPRSRRSSSDGKAEEDLLFKDAGYGLGGLQLPGLADPLPSAGGGGSAGTKGGGNGRRRLGSQQSGWSRGDESDSAARAARPSLFGPRMYMFDQMFYRPSDDEDEAGEEDGGDEVGALLRRVEREWAMMRQRRGRELRGRGRYVLDTAADDEVEEEECYHAERKPEAEVAGCEENNEEEGRKRKKGATTTTLSALCLSLMEEGHGHGLIPEEDDAEPDRGQQSPPPQQHEEHPEVRDRQQQEQQQQHQQEHQQEHQPQQQQQQQQQEEQDPEKKKDGAAKATVDVAAAVKLRKEEKRARRMQSLSSSRLRRTAPSPVPTLFAGSSVTSAC